jgi:tryptophan-rich sensory protein
MKFPRKNLNILLYSIIIPLLAGFTGTFFSNPRVDIWYNVLEKPSFQPPDWIFGPVWTFLYILMGIALYKIITSKAINKKSAYFLFVFQLILNTAWSLIFFNFHLINIAFIELLVLWFFILLTILEFYKINKLAAYLLYPYIIWVTFAGLLNYFIWILN